MSQLFNDYDEYADTDTYGYLNSASVDLMIEYLREQINSPYDYQSKNYVDDFIGNYNFSKKAILTDYENCEGVEATEVNDMLTELGEDRNKFVSVYLDLIYEKLSIGLNEFEEKPEEFQNNVMSIVYKYFILNIKRNYKNLCLTYILDHKQELARAYKRSGDITSLAQKHRINSNDSDYIVILSSLKDIIRDAINAPYDINEFVIATFGCDPPEYDQVLIKELIDKDIITGNFVPYYLSLVPTSLLDNIEFIIRYEILNKFSAELDEDSDDDDYDEE